MLPCPSCRASDEAAAAHCSSRGAERSSATKLESAMLRPRLRAFPLLVTALVCGAAGLGAASFAFRSQPIDTAVEVIADEHSYVAVEQRVLPHVDEALRLSEGQTRSYALSIGTHLLRIRSQPNGLLLQLGGHADCTTPLPTAERTWFETRCTLSARSTLTVSNPPASGAAAGEPERASIYLATVLQQ